MAELRGGALREDLPGRAGNDEGTRVGAAAEGEAGRRVGAADVPALDGLTVDDARDRIAVADQDANLGEGLVEEAESPGDEEGFPVSGDRLAEHQSPKLDSGPAGLVAVGGGWRRVGWGLKRHRRRRGVQGTRAFYERRRHGVGLVGTDGRSARGNYRPWQWIRR